MSNVGVSPPYVQCPLNCGADTWPYDDILQSIGGLGTYCSISAGRVPHRYLRVFTSTTVLRGHVHEDRYSSTRKFIPIVTEIAPTFPSIQILIMCPA